jgi:hypothetical protein
MESMTHNLTAVIIQILCLQYFQYPFNIIFTIIFALFSHFISDAFSKLTYHTPEAKKKDKFWLVWHIIIILASITTGIVFAIKFWLGLLMVNLPDIIDWYILRPLQKRNRRKNPKINAEIFLLFHPIADWIRYKLLFWLPDLTYKKYGIITELITIGVLSVLIYFFI